IVRHKLVTRIVNAYDAYDRKVQEEQKEQHAERANARLARGTIKTEKLPIIEGDSTNEN
ncbi:MAG: hypothetical protein HXL34_07995, partial [Prevotellaceae bacterium]|nr:hypothetical protein [Prevotellaceae bacterium]